RDLPAVASRRPRVDRARPQLAAFLQVARPGADDQRRGGVHEDDVSPGAGLSAENRPDDLGALLAVAAEQVADRRAREAEIFWADVERSHDTLAHLGDPTLAGF